MCNIFLTKLLVVSLIGQAFGAIGYGVFSSSDCHGHYNVSYLAKLDRVCEDCYSLYREIPIKGDCR